MVDGNLIGSVAKALELLELLSHNAKPMQLTELVACSGYPKSTVFGLLATMRAYAVVRQTPDGKYALGLRLFEYGRQVERSWDIVKLARAYLEHLSEQSGASAILSICEANAVMTVDQVMARDNLHVVSEVGARLPIWCTSQGKIFLSHRPEAEAQRLLQHLPLTAFTPHTITDIPLLMEELRRCREDGYAIENGEYKIGLRSISAPVYMADGSLRYTVGVIGMFRSTHAEEFKAAIHAVKQTAEMISAALGYSEERL